MEKELKKRMWKPEEDMLLKTYIEIHGEGNWSAVSKKLGLQRGGKSCRLRWKNYLRPDIKHGSMSKDEEDLIIRMHKLIGNRWSLIAGRLPGRTDNEVKNYWNTHLSKKENSPKLKRKVIEGEDEKHESSSQKKLKMEEDHNHGSTQEETRIIHEEDSNSWMNNLTAVQLVADSHARNYDTTGNLGMGRDFGEFLICGQEQLAWDHATYVLFDAYGVNWEDTLPPS